MKINIHNVFIGTIKKCINHSTNTYIMNIKNNLPDDYITSDSIILKKVAVLIKVCDSGFVDLDTLNSFLDEFKVKKQVTKNSFYSGGLILGTSPSGEDSLFIDKDTLQPYVLLEKELTELMNMPVKKLKKKLLLDPRISSGIE